MQRIWVLLVVVCALSGSHAWAQQQGNQDQNSQGSKVVYYDRFDARWLDPAKWLADFPWCVGTLECVREIQDGRLRLEARNYGAQNSDADGTWSASQLDFVNPNVINSITADIFLRSFPGVGC